MAGGSFMRASPALDASPLGLDEAIRRLEAGEGQDICVDLGAAASRVRTVRAVPKACCSACVATR